MYEPQPNRQKKEWADLDEIIGQSYERRLADERSGRSSLSLGRYLQASRQNAGLTLAELAHRAKLSPATLLALEQGLFDIADIQPKWLKRLASALREDVEDFHLLLGNPANSPSLIPHFWDKLFGLPLRWAAHKSRRSLIPIYAIGSVLLICLAFVTFITYGLLSSPSPSSEQIDPFIQISSDRRLNMVKAENLFEYQVISLPPTGPITSSPQ